MQWLSMYATILMKKDIHVVYCSDEPYQILADQNRQNPNLVLDNETGNVKEL